ncbi:hypothetical protein COB72_05060 [bacterium]|nr:MAG: hypothetical protein COB72_05060 [bacterium]
MTDQHRKHPNYSTSKKAGADRPGPDNAAGDMVCVTLQRPPHFWRFACAPQQTGDLLERLAEIADDPNIELTWADAELIASEIVIHHQVDTPSAGPSNDR